MFFQFSPQFHAMQRRSICLELSKSLQFASTRDRMDSIISVGKAQNTGCNSDLCRRTPQISLEWGQWSKICSAVSHTQPHKTQQESQLTFMRRRKSLVSRHHLKIIQAQREWFVIQTLNQTKSTAFQKKSFNVAATNRMKNRFWRK